MKTKIDFTLNGIATTVESEPHTRLLDLLRRDLGLTGAKDGCSEGECGACSVLIDGKLINSCLMIVSMIENKAIITIEGYRETEKFQVLKKCFETAGSVQCGFCTPGMLLACEALLLKNPHPDREMIVSFLSGNLCRCTGYDMIVTAVLAASKEGDGLW